MNEVYSKYGYEFRFNDPVEVSFISFPYEERIGRIVQVRRNLGLFGSDIYLVRRRDGSLQSFENVFLQPFSGDEDMPEFEFEDSEEAEYSISKGFPEVGFLIENKEIVDV